MSKVGRLAISLPEGVRVKVSGRTVFVDGPKGTLSRDLPSEISVEIKDGQGFVICKGKTKKAKALHGTYRALILNMVFGVTEGWSKRLELVGTGYRAELDNGNLVLSVGHSHPVKIEVPEGINFKVEKTQVIVEGVNKELVGDVADRIRRVRPPEPYKGKGIRYEDEVVRRKPGKTAKAQGVGAA